MMSPDYSRSRRRTTIFRAQTQTKPEAMKFHFQSLTRYLLLLSGAAGFFAMTACQRDDQAPETPDTEQTEETEQENDEESPVGPEVPPLPPFPVTPMN